jgi:hypothetical protein
MGTLGNRNLGTLAPVLALVCLLGPGAAAQERVAEGGPFERIDASVQAMEAHYTNARMKLGRPISGAAAREPSGSVPPARQCCAFNQASMLAAVDEILRAVDELDGIYGGRGDGPSIERVALVRTYLAVVTEGLAMFNSAPSTERARGALDGIVRPFTEARRILDDLAACCPAALAPPRAAVPNEGPPAGE